MRRRPVTKWSDVANALAASIPRQRLHPAVLAWAEANARSRVPWYVALSGGADSVVVLLLLWAHWPERRARLRALHFDHRLRGRASTADAAFCQRLCRALRVPLTVAAWRRPRSGERPNEAEARAARFGFFQRHARTLWTGHHADDVAETILMRLARGSGAGGLAAPRPVQSIAGGYLHLRPLLGLRKQEIVTALKAAGGTWCEDETNAGEDYFRNRIRRGVLPRWEAAAQRDAVAGAVRSRELLAEDDAALESWLDDLHAVAANGDLLLSRLRGKPRALCRRAIHRWLLTLEPKVDVSRQAVDLLLGAIERGAPTRHSLGRELFAVIRHDRLRAEFGNRKRKFQRRVN